MWCIFRKIGNLRFLVIKVYVLIQLSRFTSNLVIVFIISVRSHIMGGLIKQMNLWFFSFLLILVILNSSCYSFLYKFLIFRMSRLSSRSYQVLLQIYLFILQMGYRLFCRNPFFWLIICCIYAIRLFLHSSRIIKSMGSWLVGVTHLFIRRVIHKIIIVIWLVKLLWLLYISRFVDTFWNLAHFPGYTSSWRSLGRHGGLYLYR